MDPNACLQKALDAIAAEDREEAAEALRDLADWIEKGGFFPELSDLSDLS